MLRFWLNVQYTNVISEINSIRFLLSLLVYILFLDILLHIKNDRLTVSFINLMYDCDFI